MATPMNLTELISTGVTDFVTKSKGAEKATVDAATQASELMKMTEASYREAGREAAVVTGAAQAAQREIESRTSDVLNATGGHGRILNLLERMTESQETLRGKVAKLRDLEQVTIWDGLFDFISARFEAKKVEGELEGEARVLQLDQANLTATNQAVQQSAQTAKQTTKTVTDASAAAATSLAAREYEIRANQAAVQALQQNLVAVEAAIKGPKERLDVLFNVAGQVRAEESQRLARQQFALSEKRYSLEATRLDLQRKSEEQQLRVDQLAGRYINTARDRAGKPRIPDNEMQAQLKLMSMGAAPELQTELIIGKRMLETGTGMLGTNPAESLQVINAIQPRLAQAQRGTVEVLKQVEERLAASKDHSLADQKGNEKKRADWINAQVAAEMDAQFRDVDPGSQRNLFNPGDISPIIQAAPKLLAQPFVQKVLLPQIQAGQQLTDPNFVLDQGRAAVLKGTITESQLVSAYTDIYRTAVAVNVASKGFDDLGIPVPKNGLGLNVRPVGWMAKPVDRTDPVAVSRYLNAQMAKEYTTTWGATTMAETLLKLGIMAGSGQTPGGLKFGSTITYTPENTQAAGQAYRSLQEKK